MLKSQMDRRLFVSVVARSTAAVGTAVALPVAFGQSNSIPVRQSISTMDEAKLIKLEAAISEMMDRSKRDPRDPKGWLSNAESHNEFCATAGQGPAQIHSCYWFLPWHRAFLINTERKIREIAGDSSLCLPYWNWSSYRRIPSQFLRPGSSLARAIRYTQDRNLEPSEVDYFPADPELKALGFGPLSATRFVATVTTDRVQLAKNLSSSFGGIARPNPLSMYGQTRVESGAHGSVHVYVGGVDEKTGQGGDMSNFATAAKDPIFFAHHGNLDRLWEIWRKTNNNQTQEPTTSDFLKRTFLFSWLDGKPVDIKVSDLLDQKKLGYAYDNLTVFATASNTREATSEGGFRASQLNAIASADLSVPGVPESASGILPRYQLEIEGLETPRRVLSASVILSKRGAPVSSGLQIGNISIVRMGNDYQKISETIVFDITAAVKTLNTRDLKITVVPNTIGGERRSPYENLKFRRMRIVVG